MAKFYGGSVKVGKKGDSVYRIRFGETIESQYQPIVANPQTVKQVEVRAKLKLMSQLSAVLGPVIAIKRVGAKSPRNLFTKANYVLVGYAGEQATANLNRVQLTKSVVGMTPFSADRTAGDGIHVNLEEDARADFNRVVYVAVAKQSDQTLRLLGSTVQENSGESGTFAAVLPYTANAVVVYAYGIRDNNGRSSAAFGNLTAPTAEEVARLIISRRLLDTDTTLSETLGLTLAVGENSGSSESFEGARVYLSAIGSGTVSGAGRFPVGTLVTVHATAAQDAEFDGWYGEGGAGSRISANADYSFTLTEDTTLVAKFIGAPVTLTVQSEDTAKGTVSGGDTVPAGTSVLIHATPKAGYRFLHWKVGNVVVSTLKDFNYTVLENTTIVAYFEEAQGYDLSFTVGGSGEIVSSNAGTYGDGDSVTPTFTKSSASTIDSIMTDGVVDTGNWTRNGNTYTRNTAVVMSKNIVVNVYFANE